MKKRLCLLLILLSTAVTNAADKGYIYLPNGADFFVYGRGTSTFIVNRARLGDKEFTLTLNRLSSGKRINSASDDPAGLAVAEKMDSMIEQIMRDSMNDADMRNLHNFVESSIASDHEIVKRIRELALQATNGILGPDDREFIQTEVNQLLAQINMNARFSQFNKVPVIPELTTETLGLDKINIIRDPEGAIGLTDSALKVLTVKRVMQGVKANILTIRIEGKSYYYLNLQAAESRITDYDMAEGISELVKQSVLIKTRYGLLVKGD
ncbi:MAG TPA: flagellin [Spirochaetota bacterium]|nr:flagellin [Spirochaetota bacterium]